MTEGVTIIECRAKSFRFELVFFHHLGLDRNMRDQFRDHPCYDQTVDFCAKYDGPAFNAVAETLPLDFFEPMVRRVLAGPKVTIYAK